MKELFLLEQWVLTKPATNAEHQQAVMWLRAVQEQITQLSAKVEENANDHSK